MTTKTKKPVKFVAVGHKGCGQFPLDMLRYDSCYPTDSESVSQMLYSFDAELRKDQEERGRPFVVRLAGENCSGNRWSSFGWTVMNEEDYNKVQFRASLTK